MGNQPSYFEVRAQNVYQQHMNSQPYNRPLSRKRRPARPPPPDPDLLPPPGTLTSDIPTINNRYYQGGRLSSSNPELLVHGVQLSKHDSNFILADSSVISTLSRHNKRPAPLPPAQPPPPTDAGSAPDLLAVDITNAEAAFEPEQELLPEGNFDAVFDPESDLINNADALDSGQPDEDANELVDTTDDTEAPPALEVFHIEVPPLKMPEPPPQPVLLVEEPAVEEEPNVPPEPPIPPPLPPTPPIDLNTLSKNTEHFIDKTLKDELLRAAAIRATRPHIRDSLLRPTEDAAALRAELRYAHKQRKQRSLARSEHEEDKDVPDISMNEVYHTDTLERYPATNGSVSSPEPPPSPAVRSPIRPVVPGQTKLKMRLAPKGFTREYDLYDDDDLGWSPAADLGEIDQEMRDSSAVNGDIPNFSLYNQIPLDNLTSNDQTSEQNTSMSKNGSLKNVLRSLGKSAKKLKKRAKLKSQIWSEREAVRNQKHPIDRWTISDPLNTEESEVTMLKCYTSDGQLVLVPRQSALAVAQSGDRQVLVPPRNEPEVSPYDTLPVDREYSDNELTVDENGNNSKVKDINRAEQQDAGDSETAALQQDAGDSETAVLNGHSATGEIEDTGAIEAEVESSQL